MANATTATRGITYLRIRNLIGNHWNKVSRGAQNLRINEKVFQSAEIPPTESIYIILSSHNKYFPKRLNTKTFILLKTQVFLKLIVTWSFFILKGPVSLPKISDLPESCIVIRFHIFLIPTEEIRLTKLRKIHHISLLITIHWMMFCA